jgi:predicted RNA methylase
MKTASYKEQIKKSAKNLLGCKDDFILMKHSVDQMYQVFSEITGVTIQHLNQDKDIMLPSGKAIGMAGAAHCLLEMKRTAVFLRGINKAILQKQQEKKESQLHILYAGTGPYGTLIIPLLLLYNKEELKVDLLDINPDSLAALQKVINALELGNYIGDIYCSDAATIRLKRQYDIVISETMQACLKNEPQVAITQNLIPQCGPDTVFIPEQITIDAYLKKRGIWDGDQLLIEGGKTSFLSELFAVDKQNLESNSYRKVVDLPQSLNGPYDLLLYTTIKVFCNEVLGLNDCSLNMPLRYFEFRDNYPKSIEFWYNQSNKPKIESKILDYIT